MVYGQRFGASLRQKVQLYNNSFCVLCMSLTHTQRTELLSFDQRSCRATCNKKKDFGDFHSLLFGSTHCASLSMVFAFFNGPLHSFVKATTVDYMLDGTA